MISTTLLAAISPDIEQLLAIRPESIGPVLQAAILPISLVIVLNLIAYALNQRAARHLTAQQKAAIRRNLGPSLRIAIITWIIAAFLLWPFSVATKGPQFAEWFAPTFSMLLAIAAFALDQIRRLMLHRLPGSFILTMVFTSMLLFISIVGTLGYTNQQTAHALAHLGGGMRRNCP